MSILRLILAEIRFRKLNAALGLIAIAAAATLFVAGPTLVDGYGRESDRILAAQEARLAADAKVHWEETTRIMKSMGFNLRILHRDTRMDEFWSLNYAAVDMPQVYVQRLAEAKTLTLVTHLVATLQGKIDWNGRKALLKGVAAEATQGHLRQKEPMGQRVERGTVLVGHELGRDRKKDETIEILGRGFRIAQILDERGDLDDISLIVDLTDAQELLGKPGSINEILALGCRCAGALLPKVRAQLAEVLPETKIIEHRSIALARAEERDAVERRDREQLEHTRAARAAVAERLQGLDAALTPLVVLVCGVWVGLLTLQNVRERRSEVGILRALGLGGGRIAGLFLGKAALLGLVAGALGFGLGTILARQIGERLLLVEGESLAPALGLLPWALLGAPALGALASWLPALGAALEDPALVLREE